MKKHKVFYKKRLMRNSISVISILVAVALVFGSGVSAIDITNDNLTNENKKVVFPSSTPDGLAPESVSAELLAKNSNLDGMNDNFAPLPKGEMMWCYAAAYGPEGEGTYKFDTDTPGEFETVGTYASLNFLAGGTYTCDEKYLAVEYQNGALYEVDTETGELTEIGGGGTGLNGLALDPTDNTLYAASSYDLWTIDPETGEQTNIGSFNADTIIGLACDSDGTLFGWDVKFSGDSYLYTIDKGTGEATQVGSMGCTLLYAQDGDFFRDDDILYLTAWVYNPVYGGYLCTVDKDTGEVTIGDGFDNNCEATASMFMNGCVPPEHDVGVKEIIKPQDGYAVDPMDIELLVKNYGNHSEITDVQFEIIKCEAGPALLEETFDTWVPTGWSHYGYEQSNTNNAVGTPPEAYYGYYSGHYYSNGYLQSPPVNASGFEKINLKFRLYLDKSTYYNPYFYVHYRKNASAPWRDVAPWDNPVTEDLGPLPYEIGCYGWGEDLGSEFQMRFYWGSYYYYLQYGSGLYIDDVEIEGCAGCAEYAEVAEDAEIPWDEEVIVDDFPGWTPSEWHNEEFQDTWEEYPMSAYTLLEDDNTRNDKKQRLLSLYYPFLHDVAAIEFAGPEDGPAQTFPMTATITNIGQYEECCFKTHMQVSEIDFDNSDLLEEEYFNSYVFPPSGWTRTNTKWSYSYSSYAGGSPYEARFYYYPSETGQFRLYTPAIDTTGYGGVAIDFKHYVNHYTTPYTLRVETSPDGLTWSSVWDIEPTGSTGPEDVQILTGENVGSDTFHVSWTFDGYSWNINYWYVDNIVISGIPVSEPEWEDEVCCESINPGEEILFEFDDWTPAFLADETFGQKTYNIKAWTDMVDPLDNNRANDATQRNVILDFYHDAMIEVAEPTIGRDNDLIWDNGDTDGSNGYSLLGSPRRALLDDFELEKSAKLAEFRAYWIFTSSHPSTTDVHFWTDDDGDPGEEIAEMVSIEYTDEATGRTWFGYAEYEVKQVFEPYKLGAGIYWVEVGVPSSQPNTFWMIRTDMWGSQCWVNYDDYGFMPGQNVFGVQADLSYQLWGGGGTSVYVAPGNQDIVALASNIGTFPETGMTAWAEIYEFITDCENGTLIYEDNITGIDILEPLGGTETLTFDDYNFVDEGVYMLALELEDDDDDYYANNLVEWGIGVDDTPPDSDHSYEPATPDGDNGWHVSDVTVTLTAADPEIGCDAAGSGVKEIKYTIDGTPGTIEGDFGTFDITDDGEAVEIEYWAVDNVGNAESHNSFEIDMDQTIPEIEEVQWEAIKEDGKWMIYFTATATDATSGMNRVEMYINDGIYQTVTGGGPTYEFTIEWSNTFKYVMFTFIHYDEAGWFDIDELDGENIESVSNSMVNIQSNQKQSTPI
jgi:hypothetical protein